LSRNAYISEKIRLFYILNIKYLKHKEAIAGGYGAINVCTALPYWGKAASGKRLLVQEGRRQQAEGRRKESLCSKLFNLFQLDSYFRHAALVCPTKSLKR
jgi:hypothetical protein